MEDIISSEGILRPSSFHLWWFVYAVNIIIMIIIIMLIFRCYFSREHIVLSYKKWCEHRIRKNQQMKSTAHDGKSYLK